MTVVTVLPRDDGHDFQQSWMVHVSGQMKSNHTTKQAAKNKAREVASDGDTLEIRRSDGTVQKRVTVRAASADSDSDHEAKGLGFGIPRSDGEHGQGTLDVNDLL
jgi:hypothetical protein